MEIREFREGDVLVLAPDGIVAGSEETSAIETRLGTALKAGFRRVVLDCAAVGKLPSDAIRILLMTSQKLDRVEGRLVLCGMNAKLKKAFSISGFDQDFTVVATREEALQRVLDPVPPRQLKTPKIRTPKASPSAGAALADVPAVAVVDVVKPPMAVPEARSAPADADPEPAVQISVPPTAGSTGAPPTVPDRRDALATALLDALGVHVARADAAGSSSTARSDLDALASGILAALRVGGS